MTQCAVSSNRDMELCKPELRGNDMFVALHIREELGTCTQVLRKLGNVERHTLGMQGVVRIQHQDSARNAFLLLKVHETRKRQQKQTKE